MQTRSRRATFVVSILEHCEQQSELVQRHPHFRWTRSELVDLLRTRRSLTVVILPPVVVHADMATAAGLFGLLWDARVQVVENEEQIKQFLALGERLDVTVSDSFTLEELKKAKAKLQVTVKAVFKSAYTKITLHPAVVFRLCIDQCK